MMIMIPPIHMDMALQMRRLIGCASTSGIIESPVVVIPLTASKRESTRSIPENRNGSAEIRNMTSQTSPMRTRPFTVLKVLDSLKSMYWSPPATRRGRTGAANTLASSPRNSATPAGTSNRRAKTTSRIPRVRAVVLSHLGRMPILDRLSFRFTPPERRISRTP